MKQVCQTIENGDPNIKGNLIKKQTPSLHKNKLNKRLSTMLQKKGFLVHRSS